MDIRKAEMKDLNQILGIYAAARAFMRDHGNPNQWREDKPAQEVVVKDILEGVSLLCTEGDEVLGVMRLTVEEDPTYKIIEGAWLSDTPYAVVHRIASSGKVKGTGEFMLRYAMERYRHIRIDTHKDNYVMRNLLNKLGFTYCGIIFLEDGDIRDAYELIQQI